MNRTVLQIPLDMALRKKAEKQALEQGFSSLQEAVRVFLSNLATKKINVSYADEKLSARAEKRYDKMLKDVENGKNVYVAKDVDDLMRQLHDDSIS